MWDREEKNKNRRSSKVVSSKCLEFPFAWTMVSGNGGHLNKKGGFEDKEASNLNVCGILSP